MARALVTSHTNLDTDDKIELSYLTAVNGTPTAGQFRSTITGRGKMVDLSNDLLPRMGIERVQIQQIVRVDGEIGPAGEAVYKPANDKFDQIRFYGLWLMSTVDNLGAYPNDTATTAGQSFVEVTFYGTGLNILTYHDGNATRSIKSSVDGGSLGAELTSQTGSSNVLGGRNYATNQVINLASNLTLGIHTVRIQTIAIRVYGFEILNESTSVKTSAGSAFINGQKRTLSALDSSSYNSGFTNQYGTAGTRGGHVLVYMASDGTIKKDVQWTNTSSATLASADHTNEEVIRTYYWREFSSGRSDDFSFANVSGVQKAFTLDDGTTTLVGTTMQHASASYGDSLFLNANGSLIITFVGTGLDIFSRDGSTNPFAVAVDGISIGTLPTLTSASVNGAVQKIVSGLPYGTHTVKFSIGAGADSDGIFSFIVYGPKKPTLPTGAIELADYNIVADYVRQTNPGSTTAAVFVSQGVLKKMGTRELVFTGTWGVGGIDTGFCSGWNIGTTTATTAVSLTFFGTGFDWRTYFNNSTTYNVSFVITNVATNTTINAASFTTGLTQPGTGLTLTPGTTTTVTGTTSATAGYGNAISVSGLPLALYKVTMTQNGTGAIYADSVDIITPIHVHKNNGPYITQNTLAVGSTGINDGRTLPGTLTKKPSAQAIGITNGPVTSSSQYGPLTDMIVSIKTTGNPILITFGTPFLANVANAGTGFEVFVDGVVIRNLGISGYANAISASTAGNNTMANISVIVPVSAGFHNIYVAWTTDNTGTRTAYGFLRNLTVVELSESK